MTINSKNRDDSPLSKLRNLKPIMYPIKNADGEIVGYDYGIDIDSVESMFPWMVQQDTFGRKFLNKDAMMYFMLSCILEQDNDVEELYRRVNHGPRFSNWDPDKLA